MYLYCVRLPFISGVARGGDGGGPPRAALFCGGGKIEVVPKNLERVKVLKNKERPKKGRQKNFGRYEKNPEGRQI